jgi:hypothetical protein
VALKKGMHLIMLLKKLSHFKKIVTKDSIFTHILQSVTKDRTFTPTLQSASKDRILAALCKAPQPVFSHNLRSASTIF